MPEIVLDIETASSEISAELKERLLEGISAPSNWKDPAKIEAYVAQKRAEAEEKFALSPLTGRVTCIGLALGESKLSCFAGEDEAIILRKAVNAIEQFQVACRFDTRLVTFGGRSFDLPFLFARCAILRIALPQGWNVSHLLRPYSDHHLDLLEFLGKHGSLTEWALAFGLDLGDPEVANLKGSDMPTLWQSRDFETIQLHCQNDVRLTHELYWRLLPIWRL
jgi:hypothetical protein